MKFLGIALGARKSGGKDTVLEYLQLTRTNIEVVRCKQPIVDEYLRLRNQVIEVREGHKTYFVFEIGQGGAFKTLPRDTRRADNVYIKTRDDADLIWFSSNVIRDRKIGNPQICSKYLMEHIPPVIGRGNIPVVPDMRRFEENDTLFRDLQRNGYPMLCMKLEASMEVLMQRTIDRDGDLRNWHPDDDTEREVDELRYHYIVDNNKNEMRPLVMQLETVLARHPVLRRTLPVDACAGCLVRVIDPNDDAFWKTGIITADVNDHVAAVTFGDMMPTGQTRSFMRTDLICADGGCLA